MSRGNPSRLIAREQLCCRPRTLPIHDTSFHSGGLPTSKSNFGTTTALFNAAGEFQCPSIGSIGGKHDAQGKHFCTVP
jgi:hypothetical protein